MILKIDRSHRWTFDDVKASISSYETAWENPHAQGLHEVDLDKVVLLPLLNGRAESAKVLRREVRTRLAEFESQGYIFLDAPVVSALLRAPETIPALWGRMTESENYDDQTAQIRFDGTVFRLPGYLEENVMAPFACRGHWGWGYDRKYPEWLGADHHRKSFTAALLSPK